jgi:hypothetical protein
VGSLSYVILAKWVLLIVVSDGKSAGENSAKNSESNKISQESNVLLQPSSSPLHSLS